MQKVVHINQKKKVAAGGGGRRAHLHGKETWMKILIPIHDESMQKLRLEDDIFIVTNITSITP